MLGSLKRRQRKSLKIFQANTARGQTNHDLALALACEESADIILIQEPWIMSHQNRKITKQHADYICFSPLDCWEIRPRVMTYVRKSRNLIPTQCRPTNTGDICWIKIMGTTPQVTIVNVYRPPQESSEGSVITALNEWAAPPHSIIAGDFNTRHSLWDSRTASQSRSEPLLRWIRHNALTLMSPAHESTHNRGGTLDLVFSNFSGVECNIEEHLNTTSDHETLITHVQLQGYRSKICQVRYNITPDVAPRFSAGVKETINEDHLPSDPDELAQRILDAIQINMERHLQKRNPKQQGTKWWTEECAQKAAAYRQARRIGDATPEKHALRQTTRAAKRAYWQNQVQNAQSSRDIFRITRWHKLEGNFAGPPIIHEGREYTDSTSKADIFKKTLLERRTVEEDITWDPMSVEQYASLDISDDVNEQEVERCLTRATNTAPGIDGIQVEILRACWDSIKKAVLLLYRQCIKLGYHPKIFQKAEVVVLPKPKKRDLSSPRSWRPITLLPCLGKGLERLIARRVSQAAVKQGVLSTQQFGALPKRSATDLVSCLVHDVERARSCGKVASLLTLDIKGAFDTVLSGRLQRRLYEQRWPNWLIMWVKSFMSNRSIKIRLGDTVTEETKLHCGLPQGSPVSPILFMLYTEPILRVGKQRGNFSYADDIAILRTGHSLTECTEKITNDLERLLAWGQENALSFDPEKTELQHFTQAPRPKEYPGISIDGKEIEANQVTRWLGIWLDRKLSFLTHCQKWAAKAALISNHLRRLNHTQRGSSPRLIWQAVKACVIPTALYGAEVWWPGDSILSWSSGRQKELKHRCNRLLSYLGKPLISGIRAILPIYRTTPISALHRESGIPPVSILLAGIRLRHALRIQTLDQKHPMRQRAYGRGPTRLTQTANLLPKSQDAETTEIDDTPTQTNLLIQPASHDIHLFTDGSCFPGDKAGGGYVIYQAQVKIAAEGFPIDRRVEPTDAEIIAIYNGLLTCLSKAMTKFATNIIIYCDNKTVTDILGGKISRTSRKEVCKIRKIQSDWAQRERLAHVATGKVFGKFIPGHSGNKGNEEADSLAKAGAQRASQTQITDNPSHLALKKWVRHVNQELIEEWWEKHAPTRYKTLGIKATGPGVCPTELSLPRPILSLLLASRTGHGDFKTYHERFKHVNIEQCECGEDKAPEHFFFCRKTRRLARKLAGKRRGQEATRWLLGSAEGAVAFGRIIK